MSGKVKMRCPRCGKKFDSNGKQVLCAACAAKERASKVAARAGGPQHAAARPARTPQITGPAAAILVPGAAVTTPPVTPAPGDDLAAASHDAQRHASEKAGVTAPPAHERAKTPRDRAAPQPSRPRTPPFAMTEALRQRIEARYLELADPVEFDGIRTQIATELGVPKGAVKRVVSDLRTRMQLPSWWELRAFQGSDEDLARIVAAYEPALPIPPIGIHKTIADRLGVEPGMVYQGIRRIRAQRKLPQYNPPEAHAGEITVTSGAGVEGAQPAEG